MTSVPLWRTAFHRCNKMPEKERLILTHSFRRVCPWSEGSVRCCGLWWEGTQWRKGLEEKSGSHCGTLQAERERERLGSRYSPKGIPLGPTSYSSHYLPRVHSAMNPSVDLFTDEVRALVSQSLPEAPPLNMAESTFSILSLWWTVQIQPWHPPVNSGKPQRKQWDWIIMDTFSISTFSPYKSSFS